MDINQDIARLKYLQRLVASAAPGEANAMAKTFQDRVVNVTLQERFHPPRIFYKAPPGRPPAYASGNLAASIRMTPAFTSVRASSSVYATAVYAALQEFGGQTWPSRYRFMHWRNNRGPWWKKRVTVPEHPYMRPTVDELARTGELTRAAMDSFMKATRSAYL